MKNHLRIAIMSQQNQKRINFNKVFIKMITIMTFQTTINNRTKIRSSKIKKSQTKIFLNWFLIKRGQKKRKFLRKNKNLKLTLKLIK